MSRSDSKQSLLKAKQTVYKLLDFRLRSEQELRDKLKSKALPVPIIEQTIDYFHELDLVNDQRFAREWISSRLKKPFGLNRIRLELQKKGIDALIIQEALNTASEEFNELETVTALARHRAKKYKGLEPQKLKQRLYGYLTRRGFTANTVLKAINSL